VKVRDDISTPFKGVIELLDPYKFDAAFEAELKRCETQEQAYDAVEAKFQTLFDQPRFSSFESYYRCWLKRVRTRISETSSDDSSGKNL